MRLICMLFSVALFTFTSIYAQEIPAVATNMCISLNKTIVSSSIKPNLNYLNDGNATTYWSYDTPLWVAIEVNAQTCDADYFLLHYRARYGSYNQDFAALRDIEVYTSDDSTDGVDGSWTLVLDQDIPSYRDGVVEFSNDQPRWIRINEMSSGSIALARLDIFRSAPAGFRNDYWIFFGASIINGDMGCGNSATYFSDVIRANHPEFYPIVLNMGNSGETADGGVIRMHGLLADNPHATFFAFHHGGNNVSFYRPYPGGEPVLAEAITNLIQNAFASNLIPIPARLTFRDYDNVDYPADPASEYNGSLPYNLGIHDPIIEALTPYAFDENDNLPEVDLYHLFRENQDGLSDGVHHNTDGANLMNSEWARAAGKIVYSRTNVSVPSTSPTSSSTPTPTPTSPSTTPTPVSASLALTQIFQDNMVLQRNQPIRIWGTASVGEEITVSLGGNTESVTTGSDGTWVVNLSPMSAGGPYIITVEGNTTIQVTNIMIGDVYLASGQSNMEEIIYLCGVNNTTTVAEADSMPNLRLFQVATNSTVTPQNDLPEPQDGYHGNWIVSSGSYVLWIPALPYFFGKEVHLAENVPVGIIASSIGGTAIEKWNPAQEAGHYNAMIHPLMPLAIKGIIWWQGESDAWGEWSLYKDRLQNLITTWRQGFENTELLFFVVQLANFYNPWGGNWPEIREAQYRAMELSNVGVSMAIDVADNQLHPRCKEAMGKRLCYWAENYIYGKSCPFTGPLVKTISLEGSTLRVTFAYVGTGLTVPGGTLTGFEIAGADESYVTANVSLDGTNAILVSSSSVPAPVWVRYAWEDNPPISLYNSDNFAALPFRGTNGFVGLMPKFVSVSPAPTSSATPTPFPTLSPTPTITPTLTTTPTAAQTSSPSPTPIGTATITSAPTDPNKKEYGIRGFRTSPESVNSVIECIDSEEVIIEFDFRDTNRNVELDIYSVEGKLITSINQNSAEMDLDECVIRWKPDPGVVTGTYIFLLKADGTYEGMMLGVIVR